MPARRTSFRSEFHKIMFISMNRCNVLERLLTRRKTFLRISFMVERQLQSREDDVLET